MKHRMQRKPTIIACVLLVVGLVSQFLGANSNNDATFTISVLNYLNLLVFKPLCYTSAGYLIALFSSSLPSKYKSGCRSVAFGSLAFYAAVCLLWLLSGSFYQVVMKLTDCSFLFLIPGVMLGMCSKE